MINNNKILTVSYGTFSCTLEGFDDSFGTMKAIAEYFRDLSADDRYFGSEPAQPDAQMLARIAEREISRHVEAREDKGRIVLSAQNAPEEAAALVATDAVEDVADAIAEAAVADAVEAEVQHAEPEQAAEAEAPVAKRVAPAAKVIVKEPEPAAPVAEAAPEAVAAPVVSAKPAAEVAAPQETAKADIVPSLPDEEVEAFFADSAPATAADDIDHDDIEENVVPAQERAKADSIADKLKRIRAVVSQQGEAAAAPSYSEDQHADATVAPATKITDVIADQDHFEEEEETSNEVLASTLRDLEDALEADDEAETAYDDEDAFEDEDEDDDIAAILNRLENDADASDADEYADEEEDDFVSEMEEDEDDDMGGNILAAMDTVEAAVEEIDLTDDNLFEDEHEDELEAEMEAPAPAPVVPAPARVAPRTRVLKVKRATLEAAIQAGQLEEYDDDEEDEAPAATLRKAPLAQRSTLSDEAEEALARELAELEADMDADDEDDFEEALEEEVEVEAAPAQRARIRASADDDFSRLMEESEQQMEEPEAATRRDAFAHLRAAVAAKKADEAVGGVDETEETDEAYRDDLANVVRPRRPASGDRARTERPTEARPAPLKLVAEQRIDTAEPARVTPVRPRRVAAVVHQPSPDAASHTDGFADFADQMGASKLPDLLEAAAAYLSFVEGHENFSRPQLMTKVRQVEKENFTREDSLRSFGKLLREGKIEKMKGGRFQASDQIGFKPAKRAAG